MNKLKSVEVINKQCHKVTKSNEIIQKAKNGMTLQEQKIVAYLITQIKHTESCYHASLFNTKLWIFNSNISVCH